MQPRHPWILVFAAVLGGATVVLGAPSAWAHGGAWVPPGGSVPPSSSGPGGPPATHTPGTTWQTWWDLNRLAYLPGRDEAVRRRVVTAGDGSGAGPSDSGALEAAWVKRRVEAAETSLVPFLVRLLDPRRKSPDETRGAALIALAKIGQGGIHIPLLLGALHDEKAPPLVRESAAIAIGLLRRSRPELQLDGPRLDRLRGHLFDVFDEKESPDQVRAFAVLALGLLADQPYGSAETERGRAVTGELWKRLLVRYPQQDLTTALLAALALQPTEGASRQVKLGLQALASGRTVEQRTFDAQERGNAVAAAVRLAGAEAHPWLLKLLGRENADQEVRRAAAIVLGRRAQVMSTLERTESLRLLLASLKDRGNDVTVGLDLLALGRLLGAELGKGSAPVAEATAAARVLIEDARRASTAERGYAVLGLALAARGAQATDPERGFVKDTRELLLDGLLRGKGDDPQRAPYAVGLGLLGMEEALDALCAVAADRGSDPVLRGHAAAALGQIGRSTEAVRECLLAMLGEERGAALRMQASVALGLLGGSLLRTRLVEELGAAGTEYHRSHVLIALGYLGDLAAVPDLLGYAADEKRSDLSRALAIAAMGMLTDPEPRPSVLRLTEDANYPGATGSLQAAFALF